MYLKFILCLCCCWWGIQKHVYGHEVDIFTLFFLYFCYNDTRPLLFFLYPRRIAHPQLNLKSLWLSTIPKKKYEIKKSQLLNWIVTSFNFSLSFLFLLSYPIPSKSSNFKKWLLFWILVRRTLFILDAYHQQYCLWMPLEWELIFFLWKQQH